jgi:hypothetical protein
VTVTGRLAALAVPVTAEAMAMVMGWLTVLAVLVVTAEALAKALARGLLLALIGLPE